jgi:ATP-dependent RNA helicase DDX46/PRP5
MAAKATERAEMMEQRRVEQAKADRKRKFGGGAPEVPRRNGGESMQERAAKIEERKRARLQMQKKRDYLRGEREDRERERGRERGRKEKEQPAWQARGGSQERDARVQLRRERERAEKSKRIMEKTNGGGRGLTRAQKQLLREKEEKAAAEASAAEQKRANMQRKLDYAERVRANHSNNQSQYVPPRAPHAE